MKERFDTTLSLALNALQVLKDKVESGEQLTDFEGELSEALVEFFPAPVDIGFSHGRDFHPGDSVRLKGFGISYESPSEFEVISQVEPSGKGEWVYSLRDRLGWWGASDLEPYNVPLDLEFSLGDHVRLLSTDYRWGIGIVKEILPEKGLVGVDVSNSPLDRYLSEELDWGDSNTGCLYIPRWKLEKISPTPR